MLPAAIQPEHRTWKQAVEVLIAKGLSAWLPHAPSQEVAIQEVLALVYDMRTGRARWLDETQPWSPMERMFQLNKCFVSWADAELVDAELPWKVCRPEVAILEVARRHPRWMLRSSDVDHLPAGCKSFDKFREAVLEILHSESDQHLSAIEVAREITLYANPMATHGFIRALRRPSSMVDAWLTVGLREWLDAHASIYRLTKTSDKPDIETDMHVFLNGLVRGYLRVQFDVDLTKLLAEALRFAPPHEDPGRTFLRSIERDSKILQIPEQICLPANLPAVQVHLHMVMMSFTVLCVQTQTALQQWCSRLTPSTLQTTSDPGFAFLNLMTLTVHHVYNIIEHMNHLELAEMITRSGYMLSLLEDHALLARFLKIPLVSSDDLRLQKLARRHRRELSNSLRRLAVVCCWLSHDLCQVAELIDRTRLAILKDSSKPRRERLAEFHATIRKMINPTVVDSFEESTLAGLQLAYSIWNVRANRLRNAAVRDLRVWEHDLTQDPEIRKFRQVLVQRIRERCHVRAYFRRRHIDSSTPELSATTKLQFWWRMHRAQRGKLRLQSEMCSLGVDHILMLRNTLAVVDASLRAVHTPEALMHGSEVFDVLSKWVSQLQKRFPLKLAPLLRSWIPTLWDARRDPTDEFIDCDSPLEASSKTSRERMDYTLKCASKIQDSIADRR